MLQQNGVTALMLAAYGGHAIVVTMLLNARADIKRVNNVRLFL
jgi:ankyrin repeat protein